MLGSLSEIGISVSNYRCFGDESQGLEKILPVNVIIGKNSSGKSALIDVIGMSVELKKSTAKGNKKTEFIFSEKLREEQIQGMYPPNDVAAYVRDAGFQNFQDYGSQWIGKQIKWKSCIGYTNQILDCEKEIPAEDSLRFNNIASTLRSPLMGFSFFRLAAERNIISERDNDPQHPELDEHGNGATNTIRHLLNTKSEDRNLIKKILLEALNDIFAEDGHFDELFALKDQTKSHEVLWYLNVEEEGKGNVPIAESGSGLKTVILMLLNLHVMPSIRKSEIKKCIFAFEELENNLHPALQRRLFSYLLDFARTSGCTMFITTHSNVVVDLFRHESDVQLIRTQHTGECASVSIIDNFSKCASLLDDLGARASDLLQANCIIWVEGPSDRIYFNRWIDLVSDGRIKEDRHYQCLFYGGKLHARLSLDDPDSAPEDLISLLRVNSHAIFLIDRDRNDASQALTENKVRLVEEAKKMGAVPFVTHGREIENYLPQQAIRSVFPNVSRDLERFENLSSLLEETEHGLGKKFSGDKVEYAKQLKASITKESIQLDHELQHMLDRVVASIYHWNDLT
jgi:putative ATP-dependent endonuclease of OLD family